MVYRWETGFETGDFSETGGLEITEPGTIIVTDENPHSGVYSAKLYTGVGGPSGRVRIYAKDMPLLKRVTIGAWIYLQEWHGYIQFIRTAGHVEGYYTYIARVVIQAGYISLQLGMGVGHPGDWEPVNLTSPTGLTVPYTIETGRWYYVKMSFVKDVNGEARVWIAEEGQPLQEVIIAYADMTPCLTDVEGAMVGVCLYQTNVEPATLYVDDFSVEELVQVIRTHILTVNSIPSGVPYILRIS